MIVRGIAVVAVLVAGTACQTTPPRGYYAPAGVDFDTRIASYAERTDDVYLDLKLQGVYVNLVDDQEVQTVHVQASITRPRAGALVLSREDLRVDVRDAVGESVETLAPTEIRFGRQLVEGNVRVPPWERLAFDIFFDRPWTQGGPVPRTVRLRWRGRARDTPLVGECLFVRIPEGDPRHPSEEPAADKEFGFLDGYYQPGRIHLGPRRLLESEEVRLHYVFHDPGWWSM